MPPRPAAVDREADAAGVSRMQWDGARQGLETGSQVLQDSAQRAAYDALSLALREGFVFAALTGPAGSGKSTVIEAVLADLPKRSMRCIRISDPDKVPAKLADHIEQVAYTEAGKPENADKHIVLAVDDAQTASDELLRCLTRIAAVRESGQRIPQILLVGRPELWERLALREYQPLGRRLAVRAVLPSPYTTDPWASIEQELTQALVRSPHAKPSHAPAEAETPLQAPISWDGASDDGREQRFAGSNFAAERVRAGAPPHVDPPTLYALFPQHPPGSVQPRKRRSRGKLLLSVAALCLTAAAGTYVLSWYDWPDFLADSPRPHNETSPAPPKPVASALSAARTRPQPAAAPVTPVRIPSVPNEAAVAPPAIVAPPAVEMPAIAVPLQGPPPGRADTAATPAHPAAAITLAPISPEVIAVLLRRGDEEAALGDVSAARLLYQRAAEAGSALAARMAARTYDDAFLPAADAAGLADPAAARSWYRRAATLGDSEAKTRLQTLNGGP